jgi:uncharacterized protein YggE
MASKLSYCIYSLLFCVSAAFATDIPEYPFVYVVGKADIDKPPNIATCTLVLRAIDQDPGKAQSTIDGRLKSILATLSAKQVSPNDIESFTVYKRILTNENSDKAPATIRGYDVSRSLKFTARQLDSLPAIEESLVGSANVENITCQFDRTDRAAIEAELLAKAIQSARTQADKLAEPLGRHVSAAAAVSRSPFDSIAASLGLGGWSAASEMAGRMFKRAAAADDLLVPSTISMSATVNVLFKME